MAKIGSKTITHIYQGSNLITDDSSNTKDIKLGNKSVNFVYQGNNILHPNPIEDGLILWYDFKGMKNNDVSKGVAGDLSGNGNDGILNNFAFTSESGYSDGLKFDGVDDYYISNSKIQRTSKELTISISVNVVEKSTNWQYFLNLVDNDGKIISVLQHWGNPDLFLNDLTINGHNYFSSSLTKYNITITVNGKNIKVFINGTSGTVSNTTANVDISTFTNELKIVKPSNIKLNGTIYSIKMYDRVLTDQEIQHNYQLEKERWNL